MIARSAVMKFKRHSYLVYKLKLYLPYKPINRNVLRNSRALKKMFLLKKK